ncbi:putative uncharacterized protein C19orf81 homolog isoform X2 [Sceloporus undulatus]|nr:putative uncharacterized protein C19orf81 homolog isoform X2 [Sceloporus undulatus]XP_042329295.1 putative uncharacterized protein C19orf81 homolog isoform X2 [Sceloporus undulatus]XP_042329296.1 putative uncharacterized protein C19orf81 homolog isoform X2 [Sceloporus undulatus]
MQDDENEGAKLRAASSSHRDPAPSPVEPENEEASSPLFLEMEQPIPRPRKTSRQYMKRIIAEYEALDMEMPCIRKFPKPPAARPLCLCLESPPEKEMNHAEVLAAVEAVIPDAFETGLLRSIQFENINVICGTAGRKNRWLLTVSDFRTRNQLLCSGLTLGQEHFALRRWDDLVMEDYRMHLRRALARQRLLDTLSDSWDGNHLNGV